MHSYIVHVKAMIVLVCLARPKYQPKYLLTVKTHYSHIILLTSSWKKTIANCCITILFHMRIFTIMCECVSDWKWNNVSMCKYEFAETAVAVAHRERETIQFAPSNVVVKFVIFLVIFFYIFYYFFFFRHRMAPALHCTFTLPRGK